MKEAFVLLGMTGIILSHYLLFQYLEKSIEKHSDGDKE